MNKEKSQGICPVEKAGGLDNSIRKLIQNPKKIVKPYIKEGMTVLDIGCGPGFFSIEMAKLLNGSGKVIAADLQEGMLHKVRQKINGTELEEIITLHKCSTDRISLTEKVDFVLAFYMIHEVPNQDDFIKELKSILKPKGQLYIVEPKFHVSKNAFDAMIEKIIAIEFEIKDRPNVFFSRTVILENV